jgi:hypothetical protein
MILKAFEYLIYIKEPDKEEAIPALLDWLDFYTIFRIEFDVWNMGITNFEYTTKLSNLEGNFIQET